MNFLFSLILSYSLAFIPWGVKRIDKKLQAEDFPTAEQREDQEPKLAGLIADAKGEEYLKVMLRIAGHKKIWWEQRQEAVLFLGSFLKHKSVTKLLTTIVLDAEQEYSLRETALKMVSPVNLPKKAKITFLSKLAKASDDKGQLHLRVAKDLAELGAKKKSKGILHRLLERSTLDPAIKTDAEEFLKFLH